MNTQPLSLATGQQQRLPGRCTLIVRCHAGLLWITARDDARDHILRPGDSLRLDDARDVLIGALAAARLDITSGRMLREPVSCRHDRSPLPPWLSRTPAGAGA